MSRAEPGDRRFLEGDRAAEDWYRMLFEQLAVVPYVSRFERRDPTNVLPLYVGPQIQELLGVTPEEWLDDAGLWGRMVHPDDLAAANDGQIASRAAGLPIDEEYRMIRRDGGVVWIRDSSVQISSPSREVVARQGLFQDVTERRRAEEGRRAAEFRHRTLFEQLPAITFVDRLEEGPAGLSPVPEYVSPQVQEILGYTPEEFLAERDRWERALHPKDRDRVLAAIDQAYGGGGRFAGQYRMVRKDGRIVWIDEHSVLIRDESGRPAIWQGIMQDVTEKRQGEQALRASERRFRAVFDAAPVGIARLALDGWILEANDTLAQLLGGGRHDFIGSDLDTLVEEEEEEGSGGDAPIGRELKEQFARLAGGEIDRYEADRRYRRREGDPIWCHVALSLVRDEDGAPEFAIAMFEDITARRAAEEELARRAMHDALTSLPNRALLLDRLGLALARIQRGGPALAVMFLDLDGFKRVNDELGHEAGDRVLVEVAGRLRASIRPTDTLARQGGDEFVVLCEGVSNAPVATAMAERLARCLDAPFDVGRGTMVNLGVSIGVTIARDASRGGERLIREADAAMYRAKQGGRGRVMLADQGGEEGPGLTSR